MYHDYEYYVVHPNPPQQNTDGIIELFDFTKSITNRYSLSTVETTPGTFKMNQVNNGLYLDFALTFKVDTTNNKFNYLKFNLIGVVDGSGSPDANWKTIQFIVQLKDVPYQVIADSIISTYISGKNINSNIDSLYQNEKSDVIAGHQEGHYLREINKLLIPTDSTGITFQLYK